MRTLLFLLLAGLSISAYTQSYIPEKNSRKIAVRPVVPVKAWEFNLADVRLTGDSPFRHAMKIDSAYLLSVKPDRLLYRFYTNARLPVKDSVYGGWESDGLSGHTLGHYVSACALMYAATGEARFKEIVDYIVDELERCQQARKTGYIGAIPNEDTLFAQVARGVIRSSGFDLNGGWSPWYTVHKVMAGLADAYLYCDNQKALKLVKGMADWTYNTINHLTPEQLNKMLNCEYGGMNDVLASIYSITGEKKYLDLSYKFYDQFVMEPLSKKIDPMPGKHSNTQVPKAIGSARQYELTGNPRDETIASFFWTTIVDHHSYVIGGNSNYEYCGPAGKLNDRLSDNTCETCNTYNMLKLTRHLFSWQPNSRFNDFYERALYNHILASQNPQTAMMTYFVPLRMGAKKQFSDSFNTFTCCVGTGMENHTKYAEHIYSEGADGSLYVNLFISSRLNWRSRGVSVEQSTSFPESDRTILTINGGRAASYAIRIRRPKWASKGASITVNGKPVSTEADSSGYIVLNRQWKNGDKIEAVFPMSLYTESMPDNPNRIAILYGPVVMAGELGKEMPDPVYGAPVLLTDSRNVSDWVKPASQPLNFQLQGAGKPNDVGLTPFYKVYDQYYSVYWDFFTNKEWETRQAAYEEEKRKQRLLEERTVDIMRLGEMQPERDHNLKASEQSYAEIALGRGGREVRNGGFFSFDMKVLPDGENALLLSYLGDDRGRAFDILIDSVKIATQELKGAETGRFFDVEYVIPVELTKGKTKVEVKIQAHERRTAGRVFSPRIVKRAKD